MKDLVGVLYSQVPSGVGSRGQLRLNSDDQRSVVVKGARWAVEHGFGSAEDIEKTESGGCLQDVDTSVISDKAYDRGRKQQGTLGSGNHFLEVQYVSEIYDERTADAFGLFKNQVTVMIHTGSRGFGHQVCTDFLSTMEQASRKYDIQLADKELACAPFNTQEGQDYFSAMKGAANYAWANRQCIMYWCMEAISQVFKGSPQELGLSLVYDVAHNIAKVEKHGTDNLVVHRKGATLALPPGHRELSDVYRHIGQPVLIPGDMGRASFVLVGTEGAMQQSFGSTCHGAGRVLSRHQALKKAKGRAIWREMEDIGVTVMSAGRGTLAEEMSEAYKDISDVIDVVDSAGISKKVAMLKPLGVIKG